MQQSKHQEVTPLVEGGITRKLVCHVDKFKRGHVTGMQIHNQREKDSKTNVDIDKSKTHLNYDLHNEKPIKYLQAVNGKIEAKRKSKRKIRKDANLLSEIVISAGHEFWQGQGADPQAEEIFFKEAYSFMAKRFGQENVVYSMVHRDEGNPHMHFGFVPLTRDGRLSARDIHTPKTLSNLHRDFYQHMRTRGFEIEPPEPTKAKHMQPLKWKVEQLKTQEKDFRQKAHKLKQVLDRGIDFVRELRQEKQELEKKLEPLKDLEKQAMNIYDIKTEPAGLFGMDSEKIKVRKDQFEELQQQAVYTARLQGDAQRLNQENQLLHDHFSKMHDQAQEMRRALDGLNRFVEQHKDAPELKKYVEHLELKLDLIEDELGIEFDLEMDDLDLEDDQEMNPRRKRKRGTGQARLTKRKRPASRAFGRHQRIERPGRDNRPNKTTKSKKQKRDHGKIIDHGRF